MQTAQPPGGRTALQIRRSGVRNGCEPPKEQHQDPWGTGQEHCSRRTKGSQVTTWTQALLLTGCGRPSCCRQEPVASACHCLLYCSFFFPKRHFRGDCLVIIPLYAHVAWAALSISVFVAEVQGASLMGELCTPLGNSGLLAGGTWSCLTRWGSRGVGRGKTCAHRSLDVGGAHCGGRGPLNHPSSLLRCRYCWTYGRPAGAAFPFSPTARGGHVTKGELAGCKLKFKCTAMRPWPQSIVVLQRLFLLPAGEPVGGTQLPPLDKDKP